MGEGGESRHGLAPGPAEAESRCWGQTSAATSGTFWNRLRGWGRGEAAGALLRAWPPGEVPPPPPPWPSAVPEPVEDVLESRAAQMTENT